MGVFLKIVLDMYCGSFLVLIYHDHLEQSQNHNQLERHVTKHKEDQDESNHVTNHVTSCARSGFLTLSSESREDPERRSTAILDLHWSSEHRGSSSGQLVKVRHVLKSGDIGLKQCLMRFNIFGLAIIQRGCVQTNCVHFTFHHPSSGIRVNTCTKTNFNTNFIGFLEKYINFILVFMNLTPCVLIWLQIKFNQWACKQLWLS